MSYDSKTPNRRGFESPAARRIIASNSSTLLSPSALANARLREQLSAVSIYLLLLSISTLIKLLLCDLSNYSLIRRTSSVDKLHFVKICNGISFVFSLTLSTLYLPSSLLCPSPLLPGYKRHVIRDGSNEVHDFILCLYLFSFSSSSFFFFFFFFLDWGAVKLAVTFCSLSWRN